MIEAFAPEVAAVSGTTHRPEAQGRRVAGVGTAGRSSEIGHRLVAVLVAVGATLMTGPAGAQAYPSKPVRMVIAAAPGGSTDVLGRLIGQRLAERLGQPVIPENRGGGGGSVAAEFVVRTPADGYTLLMTNDQLVLHASSAAKLAYDPIRDFTPVGLVSRGPIVLGVHPDFPAKTLPELVALVKANPKKHAFSSCGQGTILHLAGELLNLSAGIDLAHVPYRGCAPAMVDAVSGQVPVFITVLNNAVPFERSGKVRLLAVASTERLKNYPNLPTIAESGFPGYDAFPWFGIIAPAGLPREVLARLNAEITAAVAVPEINERIRAMEMEPTTGTPERFGEIMRSDLAKWTKVVRDAKVKVE